LGFVYAARKRYEEAIGQYRKAIKLGLDTAEIHVSLGNAYLGLNKPDEALTEFETATRYAPELITALNGAGQACAVKKDFDKAITQYEKAVKLNDPSPFIPLAEIYETKQQYPEALNQLARAFELDPRNRHVHQGIARILSRVMQKEDWLHRFQEIVNRIGQPEVFHQWGQSLLQIGQRDSAVDLFLKAVETTQSWHGDDSLLFDLARALSDRDMSLELNPVHKIIADKNNALAHARWAEALHGVGRIHEALNQSRLALQLAPADRALYQALEPMLWTRNGLDELSIMRMSEIIESLCNPIACKHWGHILYAQEAYDEAVTHIRHALGGEDAAQLQSLLGDIYLLQGKYDQAVDTYKLALQTMENPKLSIGLARSFLAQGDFHNAIVHFTDAIRLWSQGQSIEDISWWDNASDDLSRTLQQLPAQSECMRQIEDALDAAEVPWLVKEWARALQDMKKTDQALDFLERALTKDPSYKPAHEALRDLAEAVSQKPHIIDRLNSLVQQCEKAEAHHEWGNTLLQLEKPQQAVDVFEHAIPLAPDNPSLLLDSAEAYQKCGRHEDAITQYENAIKQDPVLYDAYERWSKALHDIEKHSGVIALLSQILEGVEQVVPRLPSSHEPDKLFLRRDDKPPTTDWDDIRNAKRQQEKRSETLCRHIERNLDGDAEASRICINYGDELLDQKQFTKSLRLYRHIARLDPQNHSAFHNSGVAHENLREYETAIQKYGQAIGVRPNSFLSYCGIARCHLAQQKYDLADTAFQEAFAKDDFRYARDEIHAYDAWASALSENKKYHEALHKCQSAIESDPNAFWPHFRMGYIYSDMMRYKEAFEAYEQAIGADGDHPYPHHNMGYILERQGRYPSARKKWAETCSLYQRGITKALTSWDSDHCKNYGIVLATVYRDLKSAELLFRAGLALSPDDAELYSRLADLYQEKKRDATSEDEKSSAHWEAYDSFICAEQILKKRLIASPDTGTKLDLAELYLLMDVTEEVDHYLKEALKSDRHSARVYNIFGQLCTRTGEYKDAVKYFRSSLNRDSDDLTVRAALAQAYLKSDALDDATKEYEDVLDVVPLHVEALLGLGETYLSLAEKAGTKSGGAEDQYVVSIDYLTRAIIASESEEGAKTYSKSERARMYYLRGLANVQMYEASKPRWERRKMLTQAKKDFQKICDDLDPSHQKANRAIERINSEKSPFSPISKVERCGPWLVVGLSFLIFAVAQFGVIIGRPVMNEHVALKEQSLDALKSLDMSQNVLTKVGSIRDIPFRNVESLLSRIEETVGKKDFPSVKDLIERHVARLETAMDFEKIDLGSYAALTFGSLLFMIAGAYLPQLTSFKVAGLQLDKSSSQPIETVHSLGIELESTSKTPRKSR
jgi:tetratricopeptide (TPR) repeat protein